jgi:hypothetical protein
MFMTDTGAHDQVTWCCMLNLCIEGGEGQYHYVKTFVFSLWLSVPTARRCL